MKGVKMRWKIDRIYHAHRCHLTIGFQVGPPGLYGHWTSPHPLLPSLLGAWARRGPVKRSVAARHQTLAVNPGIEGNPRTWRMTTIPKVFLAHHDATRCTWRLS